MRVRDVTALLSCLPLAACAWHWSLSLAIDTVGKS